MRKTGKNVAFLMFLFNSFCSVSFRKKLLLKFVASEIRGINFKCLEPLHYTFVNFATSNLCEIARSEKLVKIWNLIYFFVYCKFIYIKKLYLKVVMRKISKRIRVIQF